MAVIRRQAPGQGTPAVQLVMPTDADGPGPLLAEHCCVTKYGDGSPRVPGSYKVENIGTAYRVTVYDHDAGLRLPVSGATLAECMGDIEVHLGAVDAPWELDKYLTGLIAQRPKAPKKKT